MLKHTGASYDAGYVLFAPFNWSETYLIDKCGKFIHSWHSNYPPGLCVYLLPDGSILRAGSISGGQQAGSSLTEKISWEGKVVWHYLLDSVEGQHHDIEPMPNGHVLIISHEVHTRSEVIALGRDSANIAADSIPFLGEKIVELEPVDSIHANIVWEWRPFDHLIQDFDATKPGYDTVSKHPELIDINFPKVAAGEWLHSNSVKYNADLDQILFSNRFSSEIWILDHSTTTAEAASHKGGKHGRGGDLLYRWGNPEAYQRGTASDETLFAQHDACWIPDGYPHAGEITIFNNGVGRPHGLQYSSADRIAPPIDASGDYAIDTSHAYLPLKSDWSYFDTTAGEVMFAAAVGGVQMLPNGNVQVSNSLNNQIIEVDSNGNQVWFYESPVGTNGIQSQGEVPASNPFFKARFYPGTYSAFSGRDLTPGAPLELNPAAYVCTPNETTAVFQNPAIIENSLFVFPNPVADHLTLSTASNGQTLLLYNSLGVKVAEAVNANRLNTSSLANGVYSLVVQRHGNATMKMISIIR